MQTGDDYVDEHGYFDAHGTKRIVRVHERVNRVVHGDEPSARRCETGQRVPTVDEYGCMMIPFILSE